jgi:hypothetical protein
MHTASVTIAVAVKTGLFRRMRTANLKSRMLQN